MATFVAQASGLADTAWDVISYNNGREAVVGLIPGTEISANFGADGELTGNAGCNEYFTQLCNQRQRHRNRPNWHRPSVSAPSQKA